MIHTLPAAATPKHEQGPFVIRRMRPGLVDGGQPADPALGPLSIVDHATLDVGTVVRMHEHRNDEILSYLWRGTMVHEDSTGQRVELTPQRLMMMNAGTGFWHEESTPEERVEMLQIFVRPEQADLEPGVHFYDRPDGFQDDGWHLVGGPQGSDAPLTLRNRVRVLDAHLAAGKELEVPSEPGTRQWLYVMDGEIEVGGVRAAKGDAVSDDGADLPKLRATSAATVVAFLVDPDAPASLAGSHSGRLS